MARPKTNRDEQALVMREAKKSIPEIRATLGYPSDASTSQAIFRAKKKRNEDPTPKDPFLVNGSVYQGEVPEDGPAPYVAQSNLGPDADKVDAETRKILSKYDRDVEALRMRNDGHDYNAIARELGYNSAATCRKNVNRLMKKTPMDGAEELKASASARLHKLLTVWMPLAMTGDAAATDTVVRLQAQLNELLGLKADKKVTVDVNETRHTNVVVINSGTAEQDRMRALEQMTGFDFAAIAAKKAELLALTAKRAEQTTDILDGDVVEAELVEDEA